MSNSRIDQENAQTLYTAAVVGTAHLARELERLDILDEDESLEEATALRPLILDEIDTRR